MLTRLALDLNVWLYMAAATAEVLLIKSQEVFTSFPELPFLVTIFINLYCPLQALLLWRERRRMVRERDTSAAAERDVATLQLPLVWWPGVLFGVLSAAKTFLKVVGVLTIDASLYLLLRGTLTFWTMLLAWPFLGQVPALSRVVAVLLQFSAIVCVLASNDFEAWSALMVKLHDPSLFFAGAGDVFRSPLFGVLCTLLSTILSSLNDVLADRLLSSKRYKVEVKHNARVLKFTLSLYQSLVPLLPCLLMMYLVKGQGGDSDEGVEASEFQLLGDAFRTTSVLSTILFFVFGFGLPIAKSVDRVLKYTVIDSHSAFVFELIDGFRATCTIVIVILLFREEFKHVGWIVVAVACAALAIAMNQGGPYLEAWLTKPLLRLGLWLWPPCCSRRRGYARSSAVTEEHHSLPLVKSVELLPAMAAQEPAIDEEPGGRVGLKVYELNTKCQRSI